MNPLGLNPVNFIVATPALDTTKTAAGADGGSAVGHGGPVVGIVQAVPLAGPSCSTPGDAPAFAAGGAAAGGAAAGKTAPLEVELTSLVVAPEHRRRELGSQLVRRQLAALPPDTLVWVLATDRSERFYQRLGFSRLKLMDAPKELLPTVLAGLVVARLAANLQLVLLNAVTPLPGPALKD